MSPVYVPHRRHLNISSHLRLLAPHRIVKLISTSRSCVPLLNALSLPSSLRVPFDNVSSNKKNRESPVRRLSFAADNYFRAVGSRIRENLKSGSATGFHLEIPWMSAASCDSPRLTPPSPLSPSRQRDRREMELGNVHKSAISSLLSLSLSLLSSLFSLNRDISAGWNFKRSRVTSHRFWRLNPESGSK